MKKLRRARQQIHKQAAPVYDEEIGSECREAFECQLSMTVSDFAQLSRRKRTRICVAKHAELASMTGITSLPFPEPCRFVPVEQQKSIMSEAEDFARIAAATAIIARDFLDSNAFDAEGRVKQKPRTKRIPVTDTITGWFICLECGVSWPTREFLSKRTMCLACFAKSMKVQQYVDVGIKIRTLVNTARANHHGYKKASGSFHPTQKRALEMIVYQRGWSAISKVLPLSLDKQSPFFISIEEINTACVARNGHGRAGYEKGNWSLCCRIMNLPCNITVTDLRMLASGDFTASIPDYPEKPPERPPLESYNPSTHFVCSSCWQIKVGASQRKQPNGKTIGKCRCQTCAFVLTQQPRQKLSTMIPQCKRADLKAGRSSPQGLTLRSLEEKINIEQRELCKVSDLKLRYVRLSEPHSAFGISCERRNNDLPHNIDNIDFVLAFFNPSDGNRQREVRGLKIRAGLSEPYSYHWTKEDVTIFREHLRQYFRGEHRNLNKPSN